MQILIGTPIHEMKDYSISRWLQAVAAIDHAYHLLMVDNSENPDWHKQVHDYCKDAGVSNYTLIHLPNMKDGADYECERLAFSREKIREELLQHYDYWWSWECDILCPPETLTYLLRFTPEFDAIYHTYPARGTTIRDGEQDGIGCVLYSKEIFKTFKFAENMNPLGADGRLLFETQRRGWKIIELHNVFQLEHLAT